MADSKKLSFSTTPKSWAITAKISWIGPWVGRIDWCKDHWWGSTYMAVRLSDIRPKTGKICIFCVFRLFLGLSLTASRPYRLSHINVLCINQSYQPKDQSKNISQKNIENWRFWKTQFFWVGHFGFFFSKKKIFCFIPIKISKKFLDIKDETKFWWLLDFQPKITQPKHFCPQCKWLVNRKIAYIQSKNMYILDTEGPCQMRLLVHGKSHISQILH